ncbi:MAG: acetoacetate decarboxylase family protein [Labilithrix sp.]|nr:acetoacetate decarboxylase family protein [Labilithrix sp.]MCW5817350.1 acetoacetate decarboxylase family protein [Labilithrix sp.]
MSTARIGLGLIGRPPIAAATRMRIQIFPVMATLSRLQELCDRQFNDFIPPSVAIFRPALPMVFCGILHYPDMGGRLTWQTGSLSQNELYFLVPLERYRKVDGREEFVELGATTPYIFVDNPESVAAARERFGMPKELAEFTTDFRDLPWDVGTQRYLRIGGWEPSTNGHRLGPLLDVVYSTSTPCTPGTRDDDLPRPTTRFGLLEWSKFAENVKLLAERTFGAETIDGILRRIQTYFSLVQTTQAISLFSLRQFADPEDVRRARYSDLIAFRMQVADLQSLGLLGNGPFLSHFQLRLRRTELRPIAKVLGLRVSQRTSESAGGTSESYEAIDALVPFYAQADTDLTTAERLCWHHDQGRGGSWHDDAGKLLSPPVAGRFNTHFGPSGASFLQPQADVPVLDLRYLMLAARRKSVERLLAKMLPAETPLKIAVAGRNREVTGLRLLFTRSRLGPWRHRGELVWNDGTYLSIAIPVVANTGTGTFNANFMIQEFCNNPFTVQSMRAMLGEPTNHARFVPGDAGWFASTRALTTELALSTMAVDRTSSGASVVWSSLLDVLSVDSEDLGGLCLGPDAVRDLREEIWPLVSQILPSISVGHIPSPSSPNRSLLDRVMVTSFLEDPLERRATRPDASGRQRVVRFYENVTYPLASRTGLLALDESSPLGSKIARLPSMGGTFAIPVIAAGEAVTRVRIDRFEIISETVPQRRARSA